MEYAPNGTLRTRHAAGSRLTLSTVVSYVKCIAAPLQYLHDQKLIHRDVKPENLLVGKKQEILLSDLGIAAIAHQTGSLNMHMQGLAGTPAYMAPEQAEGVPRAASDQYALGIVAYEWLCGSTPFQSTSIMGYVSQHVVSPPPSLCQRVPTLSPAVEEVILKALSKKPQERFPSITAFAEVLEAAAASQIAPTVAVVSRGEQKQISSFVYDTPTTLLVEPEQKPYVASREVVPLRHTQPLKLFSQDVEWAPNYTPTENNVVSRPVAVRESSTADRSLKPYASPVAKSTAWSKRKVLSYMIGVVPLVVLVLSISIAGFANYWTSHAATVHHATSPSQAHQTPTVQPTQPNVLATDTFQRPDQALWGKASDGNQWDGDANTKSSFSISGSTGQIAGGQGALEALVGSPTDNVDVTVSGFINQFGNNVNFGVVLRWTDPNNW